MRASHKGAWLRLLLIGLGCCLALQIGAGQAPLIVNRPPATLGPPEDTPPAVAAVLEFEPTEIPATPAPTVLLFAPTVPTLPVITDQPMRATLNSQSRETIYFPLSELDLPLWLETPTPQDLAVPGLVPGAPPVEEHTPSAPFEPAQFGRAIVVEAGAQSWPLQAGPGLAAWIGERTSGSVLTTNWVTPPDDAVPIPDAVETLIVPPPAHESGVAQMQPHSIWPAYHQAMARYYLTASRPYSAAPIPERNHAGFGLVPAVMSTGTLIYDTMSWPLRRVAQHWQWHFGHTEGYPASYRPRVE